MWLVGDLCLSTCEHLQPTIIYNLVGKRPTWKFTLNYMDTQIYLDMKVLEWSIDPDGIENINILKYPYPTEIKKM